MPDAPMPADDLRRLLVTPLAGATGATESQWDKRLGELVRVDLTRSPRSNWTVVGKRYAAADAAVDHAVAIMRAEHPYVI